MTTRRDEPAYESLSEHVLEQVLETSPIGIVVADRSGTVTLANERTAAVFDSETETIVGQNVFAPEWDPTDVDGEPIPAEENPFSLAFDGETTYGRRLTVALPDGERAVLRLNTAPIRDGGGEIVYAVATVEDVTEIDRRQRELAAKNRQLESLASVLSHDLRNPLAVARGYTDLAHETGDLSLLAKVDAAHVRMEELVDSLLLLARRGHAIGPKEPVALVTAAYAAWQSVETGDAMFDVGTDLETVVADRVRLQQLFENLFRNSVEHGARPASGRSASGDSVKRSFTSSRTRSDDSVEHGGDRVTVTVRQFETGEGFSVEDDGPGIPGLVEPTPLGEYLDRTDTVEGLGMKIVNAIAEGHDWRATVGPGRAGGLRFEFDVGTAPEEE
ncbi:PAS domain S-box protein [Halogranum amylolyticum]|uniref:PAS domain S-box protein n=1 Tax=Halogranum amylolyticum TaxID=660520 RepID=UPI001479BA98|nr:PAS domain-containing sensor histidine kinase [Halogranum amylolyticum]